MSSLDASRVDGVPSSRRSLDRHSLKIEEHRIGRMVQAQQKWTSVEAAQFTQPQTAPTEPISDNERQSVHHKEAIPRRFSSPISTSKPTTVRPVAQGGALAAAADEPAVTAVAEEAVSALRSQAQRFLSDQFTPIRLASHFAVLIVAAVVLLVSQAELPNWQFSLRDLPEEGLFAQPDAVPIQFSGGNPLATSGDNVADATDAFTRAVVPFTAPRNEQVAAPEVASAPATAVESTSGQSTAARRDEIETYVVRPGDTVLGIAARHNLAPETIQWANPSLESNPDLLRVGDRLVILPVDGVLHVVRPGDTLSSIAAKYKVTVDAIAGYPLNKMDSVNTPLSVGQQLVIPGGQKPYIPRQVVAYNGPVPEGANRGTGSFAWPTSGTLTQPFWSGHRALDIGAWTGTPIIAADSGYVIAARTGWNSGYGNMVMIDHGNGYVTLYGHMNSIFVRKGESVAKGEQLGTVGNTGNSTGPHLHFEIRYQGVPRNPMPFLP